MKVEMTPEATAGLERMARRIDDASVINLMVTVLNRGQAADRKGDAEQVAKFQAAFDVYRAEAVRRGLVK